MTPEQIDRLRELLDKVHLPWMAVGAGQDDDHNEVVQAEHPHPSVADAEGSVASLIAEGINALPDLLDALAAAETARLAAEAERPRRGVYVASKAKYGGEWVAKRAAGYPISSTWIDQFESGATSDWPALWTACINEARSSAALVLVCRPGDVLKGAWAEVGAALSAGVPVYASGIEDFSIRHHPGVFVCVNEDEAFIAALEDTP